MRSRLVMMSCVGPYTTPWMSLEGGEAKLRVLFLMPGEEVVLEQDGGSREAFQSAGEYPFRPGDKYRLHKIRPSDVQGAPTLVEVLFNG